MRTPVEGGAARTAAFDKGRSLSGRDLAISLDRSRPLPEEAGLGFGQIGGFPLILTETTPDHGGNAEEDGPEHEH